MGFVFSKMWNPEEGMADLQGKVAVVTGGNAGIGYETAAGLARKGAKVYVAARNEKKANAAIERLHTENVRIKKDQLIWLPLDLSNLDAVVEAAESIKKSEERLDILVNNAGLATQSYESTSAGFEMTMGVNHLAHFLFTMNLLPLLKRTASIEKSDVRVVTVSSSGHAMFIPTGMKFDKPEDLDYHGVNSPPEYSGLRNKMSRYALSKLANVLFCKELQRRLDADGVPIISTVCNPGGTKTEGGLGVWPWFLRPIMGMLFVAPSKGALPVLFLSGAPEIKRNPNDHKALYYNPSCKVETPSALAQDMQVAKNLWKISEEAVATYIKT